MDCGHGNVGVRRMYIREGKTVSLCPKCYLAVVNDHEEPIRTLEARIEKAIAHLEPEGVVDETIDLLVRILRGDE